MQYLENFGNTIPDIHTAVTLLKLLITLSEKAESKSLSQKLGKNSWMDALCDFTPVSTVFQSYRDDGRLM